MRESDLAEAISSSRVPTLSSRRGSYPPEKNVGRRETNNKHAAHLQVLGVGYQLLLLCPSAERMLEGLTWHSFCLRICLTIIGSDGILKRC